MQLWMPSLKVCVLMVMKIELWIAVLFVLGQSAFGDSRVFIFRSSDAASKQIGTINISPTILIRYGLELRRNSKSRFVALDSKTSRLNPTLETREGNATGFLIVDRDQSVLQVFISSRFMAKVKASVEQNLSAKQVMAREANLGVEFSRGKGKLRITRVTLN